MIPKSNGTDYVDIKQESDYVVNLLRKNKGNKEATWWFSGGLKYYSLCNDD